MTMNNKIQKFLTSNEANFEMTASHDSFDKVIEVVKINYLIGKKEKVQAISIENNILFVRNGNILADCKATKNENGFNIFYLTTESLNKLEMSL